MTARTKLSFSEAMQDAVRYRALVTREEWSTDRYRLGYDYAKDTLVYVVYVDASAFGVSHALAERVGLHGAGPLVRVRTGNSQLPELYTSEFQPSFEDMLAQDWRVLSSDEVNEVLAKKARAL